LTALAHRHNFIHQQYQDEPEGTQNTAASETPLTLCIMPAGQRRCFEHWHILLATYTLPHKVRQQAQIILTLIMHKKSTKQIKAILITLLWLSMASVKAQNTSSLLKYIGKYETNGFVVQVAINNGSLVLVVPGAPLQEMRQQEGNTFKTDTFGDETFSFEEKKGKVESLISQHSNGSLKFNRVSDKVDDFNSGDSLLTLKESTEHFTFLYSKKDLVSVVTIANKLETNYDKITNDLKVGKLPITIVRIYPDLKSFHEGINFPNAPDNVLATAFGKSDFRMTSPSSNDIDSLMFMKGVTHEFTHCVHLNIDYSPNNPRWLWEGVAMFEADWFLDPKETEIIKNKKFPHLASLNNGMEYELGYVIIEAIKDIWGFDTVIDLIKKRGDVQAVLKLSEKEFEQKVFDQIYKKYAKH
jgi:hypothetical protein